MSDGAASRLALDLAALAPWMQSHVDGFEGPMTASQFSGGQSNPTYRIDTPGRSYVLRRKPPGVLLKGAHAIEREAAAIRALGPAGFPVPGLRGLCEDPEVIGSAFYVMDLVEGRIFRDASFAELPRGARAMHAFAMNDTLAALHGLDPVAIGLGDFGRIGGYVERQVARWSRQYETDELAGRNEAMDKLVRWLPEHLPKTDETTVIHGDFRVDNMIFHPTEPRVVAVLDWELSTLGDPVADFAYHLMMYRMPPDIWGGLGGLDLAGLGIPDEAAYVARYCDRTGRGNIGREGIVDLGFYLAFNMFRFAAILHGILGRAARGNAAAADAGLMGDRFARVAALAWRQAEAG